MKTFYNFRQSNYRIFRLFYFELKFNFPCILDKIDKQKTKLLQNYIFVSMHSSWVKKTCKIVTNNKG